MDDLEQKINNKTLLSDSDAIDIVENVIDALIEYSNSSDPDRMLSKARNEMFALRDLWLKHRPCNLELIDSVS